MDNRTDYTEIIVDLTTKYMPFEAEIVGEPAVRALAQGGSVEIPARGESFDMTAVFTSIAAVTTIISNLIMVYTMIKSQAQQTSSIQSYHEATANIEIPQLSSMQREELLQDVVNAMDAKE